MNEETGGGTLDTVLIGTETVELPGPQIWADMKEQLVGAYRDQDGIDWAGGLYLLMDVQESPQSDTYYDVAVFASVRGMDQDVAEVMAQFNQSGDVNTQPTPNDVTCCWEDGGAVPGGLKQYVRGLVRMVQYTRAADFDVQHVNWHYDGEWYDQRPQGFGRMVRDYNNHQDNVIGALSDFGTVDGIYAYWNNYELVEVGEGFGHDYTVAAPTSFLDEMLNGGGDGTDDQGPGFGELTPEEIMQQQMESAYG